MRSPSIPVAVLRETGGASGAVTERGLELQLGSLGAATLTRQLFGWIRLRRLAGFDYLGAEAASLLIIWGTKRTVF